MTRVAARGSRVTKFKPATPYSESIQRPPCPRCRTRMMLASISTVPGKPNHTTHTFECPNCGNELSEVVEGAPPP